MEHYPLQKPHLETTTDIENARLARLTENLIGCLYQYQINADASAFFPFATQGIYEIYEYSATEIQADAEKVFSRIHPDDLERISASIQKSALTMQVWDEEYRVLLPSKGLCWIRGQAKPQRLENGATLWHGYLNDVTKFKKTEDALLAARQVAENATQVKSDLLSTVSHEIRTPLSGIIGLTEANLESSNPEQLKEVLSKIHRSSKQLLQILNDTLDFSKIEAGQLQCHNSVFDPTETISDLISLFKPNATNKGLQLEACIDNLPKLIESDELRLRQILSNLVSNAIKFTQQGKITVQASIQHTSATLLQLAFSVTDTGIGIAPKTQEKLFNAYSQAGLGTAQDYGGTGLGLVISERLVKLLGGSGIELESSLGRGACFSFVLPVKKASNKSSCACIMEGHLLVADDDTINRELTQHILTSLNYTVVTAENGQEAVDKANNQVFDLVLMDLNMPVMDGFTATRQIKKQNPSLPVIALTAAAVDMIKEKLDAAGFNGYVTKPFERQALCKTLARWISSPKEEAPTHNTKTTADDFNFKQGLALFIGNESAYLHLLKDFSAELNDRYTTLGQAVDSLITQQSPKPKDLIALHAETHALKGTSGNLGLKGLSQAAEALDDQLRQAIKPATQLAENYQDQLRLAKEAIKDFIANYTPAQALPINENSMSLNSILNSVKANEFIDESILTQVATKIPASLMHKWLEITEAIEQLDFDLAEKKLTPLITKIKQS